jgi:two-component system response regulator YesN
LYKILIVEDEELERTSMKIFLEENLLDVEIVGEAKSGFEAVEMIDSKDINLMLVDINWNGWYGSYQICKEKTSEGCYYYNNGI